MGKIGLFGGTFDPIHLGHLLLAERCRAACGLTVHLVPLNQPSHRSDARLTPAALRAEMVDLATREHPGLRLDRVEIERGGVSYTAETITQLRAAHPDWQLHLLMSLEWLPHFHTWRDYRTILEQTTLVLANRGAQPFPERESLVEQLGAAAVERLRFVQMPEIGISSSDIRRRVRQGQSIRFMTPPAVERFIAERGLYVDEDAEESAAEF